MRYGLGFLGVSLLAATALPSPAFASVKREGAWPSDEKKISLDVSGASKAEAVRRIAGAAGWNVVVHAPPGDPIDIHVKDLPATKVLELVLNDGNYTARREGNLIEISREQPPGTPANAANAANEPPPVPGMPNMAPGAMAAPPSPPNAPAPPAPPTPPSPPSADMDSHDTPNDAPPAAMHGRKHRGHAEDKVISGGSARVEKGDVVDDISVFGGSVDVYGEVLGDLAVMGGSATVHEGARVHGDVSAIGGKVQIKDGATVDGEVGVVGGSVIREPGAKIGGHEWSAGGSIENGDVDSSEGHGKSWRSRGEREDEARPWYKRLAEHASNAVEHTALLFVLGAVLLSLTSRRMDMLRMEIAARPMRSFALGILATVATGIALVALCVTLIGIPIAIIGVLVGTFGIYAGICAVLATLGKGLVAHKTANQHVHLAVGCVLFMIVSAIPHIGWIAVAIVGLIGFGALVGTRFAGFAAKMPGGEAHTVHGEGPYHTIT